MKKFSYATLTSYGLDAWTNNGRRSDARQEFAAKLQDKEVCEQSIINALMELELWSWGKYDSRIINKVEIVRSFLRKGMVEVKVYNCTEERVNSDNIIVKWDPEKDTYSDDEDYSKLEKRIKTLENEVRILNSKVDSIIQYGNNLKV